MLEEEFHGVDGIEHHGDAAVGDEFGGHDMDVVDVGGVGVVQLLRDVGDDGGLHFAVKVDGVDICGVV